MFEIKTTTIPNFCSLFTEFKCFQSDEATQVRELDLGEQHVTQAPGYPGQALENKADHLPGPPAAEYTHNPHHSTRPCTTSS